MELTQERLADLMYGNFAGTIKISGEHHHKIVIEIPFGKTVAESIYNDLLNLTNEKGAYSKLLQACIEDVEAMENVQD